MKGLPVGCKGSNARGVFTCADCGAEEPKECILLHRPDAFNKPKEEKKDDGNEEQSR